MSKWTELAIVGGIILLIVLGIVALGQAKAQTIQSYPSWVTKPMNDLTPEEIEEAKPTVVFQYKYCQDGRLTESKCMTYVIRMNLLCAVDSIGTPGKWTSICNALNS
jgi:hypothetical protein